jgi:hypothetical protein
MIIFNILFYLKCIDEFYNLYNHQDTTTEQKNAIESILKVWLFYNSSNEMYWTRYISSVGRIETKRVKEHRYSNKSSIKFILSNDKTMHSILFNEKSNQEKVCDILKFMQWNYTSKKENQDLKKFQNYSDFYTIYKGNPDLAYEKANITLELFNKLDEMNDLSWKFSSLFLCDVSVVIEISLEDKKLLNKFYNHYRFHNPGNIIRLGKKQVVISHIDHFLCFKSIVQELTKALHLKVFETFIREKGIDLNEVSSPYSMNEKNKESIKLYDNPKTYFITSEKNIENYYSLLDDLLSFVNGKLIVYSKDLKIIFKRN